MNVGEDLPPRVLIVMPNHWPRALLRAALRESGYDALGVRDLLDAQGVGPSELGRGPVQMVVVDEEAFYGATGDVHLAPLLARLGEPLTILLAGATSAPPAGGWNHVLRRPLSIGDIVSAVREHLPLANAVRHSVD